MNLIRATKQDEVVRLADPFQAGAGSMSHSAMDELCVTHRGMKQHRIAYGLWSNPGMLLVLRRPVKGRRSTVVQCNKRQSDGQTASDGLRCSCEAANPRGAKRPTIVEPCQGGMVAMQWAVQP